MDISLFWGFSYRRICELSKRMSEFTNFCVNFAFRKKRIGRPLAIKIRSYRVYILYMHTFIYICKYIHTFIPNKDWKKKHKKKIEPQYLVSVATVFYFFSGTVELPTECAWKLWYCFIRCSFWVTGKKTIVSFLLKTGMLSVYVELWPSRSADFNVPVKFQNDSCIFFLAYLS